MSVIITDKGAYSEVLSSPDSRDVDESVTGKAEAADTEEKAKKRRKAE